MDEVEKKLRETIAVYARWIEEGIARAETAARAAAQELGDAGGLPTAQFFALKLVQARLLSETHVVHIDVSARLPDEPGKSGEKPN